jgi:hypothetical protein
MLGGKRGGDMAWWDKPRDGKRVATWMVAVATPVLVVLTLASPKPLHWWQYIGLVLWSLLGLKAAHQLITGRQVDA